MRIAKSRIYKLERAFKHKMLPNNGNVVVSYPDNPMTDEEIEKLKAQGITVINIVYVDDEWKDSARMGTLE